jgi:hypothetical protein
MPRAKKPTAKCAIGDIRITTGLAAAEGDWEVTPAIVPPRRTSERI